jgi:hypothetical protein
MERYRNLSGDSGVVAYDIAADFIRIKFRSGDTYRYSYARPGRSEVEHMKCLARTGRGLSTFIATTVKNRYAAKERF